MNSKNKNKTRNKTANTGNEPCPTCGGAAGAAAFCPVCGAKMRSVSTEEKRARLAEKGAAPGRAGLYAGVAAVLVVAAVVFFAAMNRPAGPVRSTVVHDGAAVAGPAGVAAGVEIPLADLEGGKARHYSWQTPDGKQIRFFAIKSSDGVVRAAFDACDVCWPAHKGYRQDGDFMVCNNCGQRFASVRVNVEKGGCNPSPLERRVDGNRLAIAAADLLAGARYF